MLATGQLECASKPRKVWFFALLAMNEPLVSDDQWNAIEPLLPPKPAKPRGGRPRVPDRAMLSRIVFFLRPGCPWSLLPKELGRGSDPTCWWRPRDEQGSDAWKRLHERWLNGLVDEAVVDWSRASVHVSSVRANWG